MKVKSWKIHKHKLWKQRERGNGLGLGRLGSSFSPPLNPCMWVILLWFICMIANHKDIYGLEWTCNGAHARARTLFTVSVTWIESNRGGSREVPPHDGPTDRSHCTAHISLHVCPGHLSVWFLGVLSWTAEQPPQCWGVENLSTSPAAASRATGKLRVFKLKFQLQGRCRGLLFDLTEAFADRSSWSQRPDCERKRLWVPRVPLPGAHSWAACSVWYLTGTFLTNCLLLPGKTECWEREAVGEAIHQRGDVVLKHFQGL